MPPAGQENLTRGSSLPLLLAVACLVAVVVAPVLAPIGPLRGPPQGWFEQRLVSLWGARRIVQGCCCAVALVGALKRPVAGLGVAVLAGLSAFLTLPDL